MKIQGETCSAGSMNRRDRTEFLKIGKLQKKFHGESSGEQTVASSVEDGSVNIQFACVK